MKENIYRSAAEKELLYILVRIALRIAAKKRLELATENSMNRQPEIIQKSGIERKSE